MSAINIILLLSSVALVLGVLSGKRFWAMTETEIINSVAADYMQAEAELGHTVSPDDCAARPAPAGQGLLIITCQPAHLEADDVYEYRANRWGKQLHLTPY